MKRWMTIAAFAVAIVAGGWYGIRQAQPGQPAHSFLQAVLDSELPIDSTQLLTADGVVARHDLFSGAKPVSQDDYINPPLREERVGMLSHEPGKFLEGFTIYTPYFNGFPIRLTDKFGVTVHEWSLPPAAYAGPRADSFVMDEVAQPMVSMPHLYPNGDLLVLFQHGRMVQPFGYGIARLDKDSNVIWSYLKQTHHGFNVAPDGRIYSMISRFRDEPLEGFEWLNTPFQEELIVELSPEGEELRTVSVLEAMQNSEWASMSMFGAHDSRKGDLLHLNSVRYLDAAQASHIPGAAEGDLLLSLRNLNVVAVMSLDEPTIKWAMRGPWHMQHDVQILENGNLLVFDNRGDMGRGGASRIIEVDPVTQAIEWRYPKADASFYTIICGSVVRLPNGNTLISESNNGRIFEVTRQGDIVWDYAIPERFEDEHGNMIAKSWNAQRFELDDLPFVEELATAKP